MSEALLACIEKIVLAAIAAVVTIATAYIAARYSVSRMANNKRNTTDNNSPADGTNEVKK